jgi:hypothetical protein
MPVPDSTDSRKHGSEPPRGRRRGSGAAFAPESACYDSGGGSTAGPGMVETQPTLLRGTAAAIVGCAFPGATPTGVDVPHSEGRPCRT